MNYKKILEYLGFVEGVDFALTEESFEMLNQVRMIHTGNYIYHDAIDPTFQIIHHEEIPAVYDEEENEISPMIPEWDESIMLTPGVDAWNEQELEEEFFQKDAPSEEIIEATWDIIQVKDFGDVALLIDLYLKSKRDDISDRDSFNIVEGVLLDWNFEIITRPTNVELLALIPNATIILEMDIIVKQKGNIGKKLGEDCESCLNVITGFNDGRLTGPQLQSLLTSFATINTCLSNKMPKTAKGLILQLQPDGIIITQQMKDVCLYILKDYVLS